VLCSWLISSYFYFILHQPLPSPTPQNLCHILSEFIYKINTSISIHISICTPFSMDVEMIENIKFKLSMKSLCVLNYLLNCAYDHSTFMIGVDMCVYFILIHFHIKVEMYNMDFNLKLISQ
jgi:hypothetical protein